MTQWLAGMRMTAERMNDNTIEEVVSSGLTAATGFSVTSFSGRKVNGITTIAVTLSRTGSTLTATSAGALTSTLACTLPIGWRPPTDAIPVIFNKAGIADGLITILPAGTCTITSLSPTATLASGNSVVFFAQWISENG